jgi:hypothetical protein
LYKLVKNIPTKRIVLLISNCFHALRNGYPHCKWLIRRFIVIWKKKKYILGLDLMIFQIYIIYFNIRSKLDDNLEIIACARLSKLKYYYWLVLYFQFAYSHQILHIIIFYMYNSEFTGNTICIFHKGLWIKGNNLH